jgi:hypothetical protein
MREIDTRNSPCPVCERVSEVDKARVGVNSERLSCPQCGRDIQINEIDEDAIQESSRDDDIVEDSTKPEGEEFHSTATFEPAFPVDTDKPPAGTKEQTVPAENETPISTPTFPGQSTHADQTPVTEEAFRIPGTLTIKRPVEPPFEFYPRPVRKATEPDHDKSREIEFKASFDQPVDTGKRTRTAIVQNRPKEKGNRLLRDHMRETAAPLSGLSVPVEMDTDAAPSFWRSALPFLLIPVLLAALAMQYLWYNLESMSNNPYTARIVSLLCNTLSCPEQVSDPALDYRPVALQIRTHPNEPQALLVTFSFQNVAAREVPFPIARLSFFTTDNKNPMASREFRPEEYLEAELALLDLMPIGSQVQAELAISDPGPEAVNYTMTFSR